MPDLESFRTGALPASLPFCAAMRVGDLVFTSGQIGNVPGALKLVDGGFEAEARQALDHMKHALEAAGTSLDQVVKCTVFFTDMTDFQAFNAIYAEVFGDHRPARSGLAVKGLALGARIEIECVALAGDA